jgi:hypothetical protein
MPYFDYRLRLALRYHLPSCDCDAPLRCLYDTHLRYPFTIFSCANPAATLLRLNFPDPIATHVPDPFATSTKMPIATPEQHYNTNALCPCTLIIPIPFWAGKTDYASAVSDNSSFMRLCDHAPECRLDPRAHCLDCLALVWRVSLHFSRSSENFTRAISLVVLYIDFF